MKYIYNSDKLRLKIVERKRFGKPLIVLSIQEKGWLFWNTIEKLDIEIENYWVIPGHERVGCMRIGYQLGGYLEVWPPDMFDLKKRANDFLLEYYEANKERILLNRTIKKQLGSI